MISKGQGLLLNFHYSGRSSVWHSISPVLTWNGLQWASSTWPTVLPVLAELWTCPWSLLQSAGEKKKKIRGNYCRAFSYSNIHSIKKKKNPSASSVENDSDLTNFYWVSTIHQTCIRYQGFWIRLSPCLKWTQESGERRRTHKERMSNAMSISLEALKERECPNSPSTIGNNRPRDWNI